MLGLSNGPELSFARTRMCRVEIIPASDRSNIISYLVKISEQFSYRPVLFLTADNYVIEISKYKSLIQKRFLINLPNSLVVESLIYKTNVYRFANDLNINQPKTVCMRHNNIPYSVLNNMSFPVIIKPNTRNPEWEKYFYKVIKIRKPSDFYKNVDIYFKYTDEIIVQEYVEGNDSDLYFFIGYYNNKSEPLISFVGKKIRQWIPNYGTTASAEKKFNKFIHNESLRIFKEINLVGYGSIEFKFDKKNNDFTLMEPTIGRFNQQFYLATANGYNIASYYYKDLSKISLKTKLDGENDNSNIVWINDFSELQSAYHYIRNGELSVLNWIRFLLRKKKFALFNIHDPVPFFITSKNWIKYLIKNFFREKSNG